MRWQRATAAFLRLDDVGRGGVLLYSSARPAIPRRQHVNTSLMATARLMAKASSASAPTTWRSRRPNCSFLLRLGNAMLFPMSVGATSVAAGTADAAGAVRRAAPPSPTIFYAVPSLFAGLWRIGYRCRRRGRQLRCASPPRSAARRTRRALARGRGRRHSRRPGLNRDAADLPQQPPGDIRYGSSGKPVPATTPGSSTRRPQLPAARSASWWCAGHRPARLLESARQAPPHFREGMDLYRRQVCAR